VVRQAFHLRRAQLRLEEVREREDGRLDVAAQPAQLSALATGSLVLGEPRP
jgi:hypothetical protein